MPRFVVIGRTATASGDFLPDDVPGTSGRLDVLLRCVRAALLSSHGLRGDVSVHLVLGGGPRAPRTLRIDGASARFIRPDERSLATLVRKTLALVNVAADAASGLGADAPPGAAVDTALAFVEVKPGVAVASSGLEASLASHDARAPLFVLEEGGPDLRDAADVAAPGATFVLGDHLGFAEDARALLAAHGARPIAVGPRSLHAEDVITIVLNEIDRRSA